MQLMSEMSSQTRENGLWKSVTLEQGLYTNQIKVEQIRLKLKFLKQK